MPRLAASSFRPTKPFLARAACALVTAAALLGAPRTAAAVKVSAAIPSGYAIQSFALTPNGATVVYALEEEGLGNVVRLVAAPVAGGSTTTLVDIPLSGSQRSIDDWTITPNGTGVVFLSDKDAAQQFRNDLFRVPIDGSAVPLKLNVSPAANDVRTFRVAPNAARVVFEGANDKIYSVATTGGTPVELGTGTGSFLPRFRIAPNSARVVFPFDDGMGGGRQLYSVPIDGSGAPLKLTNQPTLLVPGENGPAAAAITPDSTKALFFSRPDPSKPSEYELWVTPIAQAAPTKLTDPLATYFPDFRVTPDGTTAVFTAGTFPAFRIYRVPVDGSTSVQPVSGVGQNVIVSEYQMSPDGQTFVYRTITSGKYRLFAVGLDGGGDVGLTPASPAGFGPYNDFRIDPSGTRVVYAAQQDAANVDELYSVPIGGGGSLKLSKAPAPVTGGDVNPSSIAVSPDGLTVIYVADQDTDGVVELFSVGIASGGPQKVHPGLAPDRDVANDLAFTPDSATILYLSDQETADVFELFATDDPPPGPVPTATPGGGGTPTATNAGTATPTPIATRTPAPETGDRCADCIDNDLDGDVDRVDGDCPPYAAGAGSAVAPDTAKSVAKCGKALGKAGSDFALKRVKGLASCLQKALACVQGGSDAACLAKAGAACTKAEAARQAAIVKVRTALAKACGDPPVAAADLGAVAGLGYAAEVTECATFGGGSLASVSDVATCLVARHACRAEAMVGVEIPRARALLTASGHDAAFEAPCLPTAVAAAGDPDAKSVLTCQKALAKAGIGYGAARLKAEQKCADGVFQCVQLKQNDAACRTKADATCAKLAAKVATAASKVTAALAKGCPSFADLADPTGVGFDARSAECAALATPADTVAGAAGCVVAQHACRIDQLLIGQSPRGDELGARGF